MAEQIIRAEVGGLRRALERDLQKKFRRAAVAVRDRTVRIMREEVPARSGNLRNRISGTVSRSNPPEVVISVNAFSRGEATSATVVTKSGKRRRIQLRARRPFNYGEAVRTGTGIFGPTGQLIRPRRTRALLVEVPAPPTDEGYVIASDKYYVFRLYTRGQRPNDYVGRTVVRIKKELADLINKELAKG